MHFIAWVLAILFTVLKFTAVIDWSWLWVLAPLWGFYGAVLALMLIFGGVAAVVAGITAATMRPHLRAV